ncbi:MAG: DinB family protein [Nitrososphaeria archaeon]
MQEIERIVDQLERAYDGRAWHGPSVIKLLSGVEADEAAARPLEGRHTIWELVLHIAAWDDVVRRVLKGEKMASLSGEEDWPPVGSTGEAAWRQDVDELKRVHKELVEALSGFSEARLDETVHGASFSFYTMLHGVVQHDLYHAGQIAILKRK